MKLNLPILDRIGQSHDILIAGMGGGFDVFCGLPLYFELKESGYDVHLASFSFSDIAGLNDGEQLTDTLIGVSTEVEGIFDYFPEYYLSEWFLDEYNEDVTIWCFEKTGARPLIKNYRELVRYLDIDCIILIDGGVDSLMHGDEPEPGTMFEDTLSLLAVDEMVNVPVRLTVCVGMGAEPEVGYAHLFENIAELVKSDAFFGSCTLTKAMRSYQAFNSAVMYVLDQQPQYPSVICSSVISATTGEYGDYHLIKRTHGSSLHISPLMSTYWFFDAGQVAKRNRLIADLRLTFTVEEAWQKMQGQREKVTLRATPQYPLP